MQDFDYSMVDLKLIDMCKMVSNLYYEDCETLLIEVLMKRPDNYAYFKLKTAIKNHLYFENFNELKNYLED